MLLTVDRIMERRSLMLGLFLFLVCAPLTIDTYNTLNQRAFMDLILKGNPFTLAPTTKVTFQGDVWSLDWPYPPLAILFDLPAWALYVWARSEAAYQLVFKLPLFLAAVATQLLLVKVAQEKPAGERSKLVFAYVLLPPVLLSTTIAGGFDIIAGFLILLALCVYTDGKEYLSGLALGFAGALRLYPLLLLPVYLSYLARERRGSPRSVALFTLVTMAPMIVTVLPFLWLDSRGFATTLASRQILFGPFSTPSLLAALLPALGAAAWAASFVPSLDLMFLALTLLALLWVYIWIRRRPSSLAQDQALALITFFLLYPKVHGLYLVALVPLALIGRLKYAGWAWFPGLIFMLTVNGAFGASGLPYWLAPALGAWIRIVPESQGPVITGLLVGAQILLLALSLLEVIDLSRRAIPLPAAAPSPQG